MRWRIGKSVNRRVGGSASATRESIHRPTERLIRPRVGSSARRLVGSSAHRLIGSSAHRLVGSSARRLVGSSARRLVGSSARRLVGSSASKTRTPDECNAPSPTCMSKRASANLSEIPAATAPTNARQCPPMPATNRRRSPARLAPSPHARASKAKPAARKAASDTRRPPHSPPAPPSIAAARYAPAARCNSSRSCATSTFAPCVSSDCDTHP